MLTEAAHSVLFSLSRFNKNLGPSNNDYNIPTISSKTKEALKTSREKALANSQKTHYSRSMVLQAQEKLREGIKWYEKAAKKGLPAAFHELAKIYLQGAPFPQDNKKGLTYLDEAISLDYPPSMLLKATIYYLGLNEVKVNRPISFALVLRAAKMADPQALNDLLQLLVNGEGEPDDQKEAVQTILDKVSSKSAQVLVNLAIGLYNGQVPKGKVPESKPVYSETVDLEPYDRSLIKDRESAIKLCQKMIPNNNKQQNNKIKTLDKLLNKMLSADEDIKLADYSVFD
jgi:TPR repeat protein